MRWGVNGLAVRVVTNNFHSRASSMVQSALVSTAAPIPTGISFTAPAQTVSEGASSVTINVIRTGDLSVA